MYNHKSGITLRKIEHKDLSDLQELKSESWWGTHHYVLCNQNDQEKWFNLLLTTESLVLIGEYEFKSIGVMLISNIDWIARSLELSGSVYKKYRKPEITKAAFAAGVDFVFEMLNMNRLSCEVLETNIPAQMLEIKYLNFVIEGKKRQAVYKSGKYYDSVMLSQLRNEWIEQERVKAYGSSCNTNFDHDQAAKLMKRFSLVKDVV